MKWTLSKSRILGYLQCPKRLYLEVHHRELVEYSASSERLFRIGDEVGKLAQEFLMPGGILIDYDPGLRKAVATTQNYLSDLLDITLYEATIQTQNVQIRADLLSKKKDVIDVIDVVEVKSSTSVKEQYLVDCAIRYWVMDEAGYRPTKINIAHINNQFVYQGDENYARLFEVVDITEDIGEHVGLVPEWISQANAILAGDLPEVKLGDQCTKPYDCPFIAHCWKDVSVIEYPIAKFPGLAKRKKQELIDTGYQDVRNVPKGFIDDEKLLARLNAYKTGEHVIPKELQDEFSQLGFPRYCLDFETIGFAVPRWKDTRPYEALPFQWSCHIEEETRNIHPREFLDTSGKPPMRSFSDALIGAVGIIGPIIVYSSYERTVLRGLITRFPNLEEQLQSIIDRLYDMYIPIKKYYFHRDLQGSYSIKKVLPMLVPELNYASLDGVSDGMMAQQAYGELIDEKTSFARKEKLMDDLLEYCKLDTLAMVELVRTLSNEKSP